MENNKLPCVKGQTIKSFIKFIEQELTEKQKLELYQDISSEYKERFKK